MGGIKRSILLTLHDREPAVLMNTFRSLYRAGLTDEEEVVIVDDRSEQALTWAQNLAKASFSKVTWVEVPDYDAYEIAGFRNPARAFNEALSHATGESIWIMSSDVLVTPGCVHRARQIKTDEMLWTPRIVDLESCMEYVGQNRLFPMPWFLVASRQKAIDVGGWDETYLQGMCYEDNDFVGRLALSTGAFAGEWSRVAYHQSHNQPAYDVADPGIAEANNRNRAWTQEKWGGIPFDQELTPFDVIREMHVSGIPVHRVIEKSGKLERVVGLTKGMFQRATA
jgi:glycosyltransferase involved in cell wall biosynthesis